MLGASGNHGVGREHRLELLDCQRAHTTPLHGRENLAHGDGAGEVPDGEVAVLLTPGEARHERSAVAPALPETWIASLGLVDGHDFLLGESVLKNDVRSAFRTIPSLKNRKE